MATIGAGIVSVPHVAALTNSAKIVMLDALDYAYADMCVRVSMANFWKGTPIGAIHARKALYQARLVKQLMNKEGIKQLA